MDLIRMDPTATERRRHDGADGKRGVTTFGDPDGARASEALGLYTGNANRRLATKIGRYLGTELGSSEVFEFANENIFVRIVDNVREKDIFLIQPTCKPVQKSIMELLIMIDAFKRASAGRITAVVPYYSYGRSDKKDQPRVPITARLIADMISVAGADRLLTMDLHQGRHAPAVQLLQAHGAGERRGRDRSRLRQASPPLRRARRRPHGHHREATRSQ